MLLYKAGPKAVEYIPDIVYSLQLSNADIVDRVFTLIIPAVKSAPDVKY